MQNLHDLFEHELQDIYDAEMKLVDALRKQASDSSNTQVRNLFEAHRKQTEGQVERLEKVFDIWGREPSRGKGCAGMTGLIEEAKEFKDEDPSPEILDAFNLGAAVKVEQYEIATYESLIDHATELGLDDAVRLLEQNLKEEEATLEKVQGFIDEEVIEVPVGEEPSPAKSKGSKSAGSKSTRSR